MPAPPIYRPGERIDGPSADKSAVRQYIVRLRGITDVACLKVIIGPHPENVRRVGQERATGLSGMRRNRSGDVLKGERGKMLLDKLQSLMLVLLYHLKLNDML